MRYAARMGDEGRKSEARALIRARVAVWRAQVWTSWLPAMVVLPGVMLGGSTLVNVAYDVRHPGIFRSEPLGIAVGTAVGLAFFIPYVLLCFVAYGLQRLSPRMKGRQMPLAFADLIGRMVTIAQIFLGGIALAFVSFASTAEAARGHPDWGGVAIGIALAGCLVLIFWVGIRRRVALRCARCGYPIGSVRRAGEVCPECGNTWKRVGGLRAFRRISSWWLVGGLGLLVMGSVVQALAR